MRNIYTLLFLLAVGQLFGQNSAGLWNVPSFEDVTGSSYPGRYALTLDFSAMKVALQAAPTLLTASHFFPHARQLSAVSSQIVNGPSFTSSTAISAPNLPRATTGPRAATCTP